MKEPGFLLLDGGMGRELSRVGAPFRQPEWSALALIEAPDAVLAVHRSYVTAGADIITTNSYALVPFHIGQHRFDRDGPLLAARAGRIARQAAAESADRTVRVAASLPPVFGSYRPDLFDRDLAALLLQPLIDGLTDHADIWLAETLSATAEARVVAGLLEWDERPLWLSFTLMDQPVAGAKPNRLRSGETIGAAVAAAVDCGAAALLFNCSQPEVMEAAVRQAVAEMEQNGVAIPIGVYANAFAPNQEKAAANETVSAIRSDLDPDSYHRWTASWLTAGARIVGGCCGIGPEHIARIAAAR